MRNLGDAVELWKLLGNLFVLTNILALACCSRSGFENDPCSGIDCSGHGVCYSRGDEAHCVCETGYHSEGLECVEGEAGPCVGWTCSGHGVCIVMHGEPRCLCDEGYFSVGEGTCMSSGELCAGIDCSGHGRCTVSQDNGITCICDPGYQNQGTVACVPFEGSCASDADCDDSDICTDDVCDAASCFHFPAPEDRFVELCTDGEDNDCDGLSDECCLADGEFSERLVVDTGAFGPVSTVVADFNSDSIQDLAVLANRDNAIVVMLGNGSGGISDGSFVKGFSIGVDDSPNWLAAGDFNSDGIEDLVVANGSSSSVSIFLGGGENGRGDGTFGSRTDYPTPSPPRQVITGDFNSDGILDLVVSNYASDSISVLLGNGASGRGDGTFSFAAEYPAGDGPSGMATGDFNSDGIPDIAVANDRSNDISILLGGGANGRADGTFVPFQTLDAAKRPVYVVSDDFNDDKIADLAVSYIEGQVLSVFLGQGSNGRGTGRFSARTDYDGAWNEKTIVAEDFQGDGITDLAVHAGNTVYLFRGGGRNGRGDGTFDPFVTLGVQNYSSDLDVGDFNSDGIMDMVVTINGVTFLDLLFGHGSGSRPTGQFRRFGEYEVGDNLKDLIAGDFNSDGIVDLAAVTAWGGNVTILSGDGADGRGSATFTKSPAQYQAHGSVAVTTGDFNADGIVDMAVVNYNGDSMGILLGMGSEGRNDGRFAEAYTYPVAGPVDVVAADFNSDGILDIVTVNKRQAGITVFIGNGAQGRGDGTFRESGSVLLGREPSQIVMNDFDSDAILDVAVRDYASDGVWILLGNGSNGSGDGTFAEPVKIDTCDGPAGLVASDFNSDHIVDLAVSCMNEDSVAVLVGGGSMGRGDGTFSLFGKHAAGDGPRDLLASDFNGDGVVDLAVACGGSNRVSILVGIGTNGAGTGAFLPPESYEVGDAPSRLSAGDFNADGVKDLAVANAGSGSVSILLGRALCLQ